MTQAMTYSILDTSQKEAIKALFLVTFTESESVEEGEMAGQDHERFLNK